MLIEQKDVNQITGAALVMPALAALCGYFVSSGSYFPAAVFGVLAALYSINTVYICVKAVP